MIKLLTFSFFSTLALTSAAVAAPVSFAIDCMIHDSQGKMVANLGMLGEMKGMYLSSTTFIYEDLTIEANLDGPFAETPEVATPQFKLTVLNGNQEVLAKSVVAAFPTLNQALFVPAKNVYVHCDRME